MAIDVEEQHLQIVEHLESRGMTLNSEGEITLATIRAQELGLL